MLLVCRGGARPDGGRGRARRGGPASRPGCVSGVPMRAGATPVYISNTTVKAGAADGTVAWAMGEQGGAPDHKEPVRADARVGH